MADRRPPVHQYLQHYTQHDCQLHSPNWLHANPTDSHDCQYVFCIYLHTSLRSTHPIPSTLDRTTYLAHMIACSQSVCSYASGKIHQRFIVLPHNDPTAWGHIPMQKNHLWYFPHDNSTAWSHDSFSDHDHLSCTTSSQAHFLQLISVCNTINSPSHHVQPMPPLHLCFLHPV